MLGRLHHWYLHPDIWSAAPQGLGSWEPSVVTWQAVQGPCQPCPTSPKQGRPGDRRWDPPRVQIVVQCHGDELGLGEARKQVSESESGSGLVMVTKVRYSLVIPVVMRQIQG